VFLAIPAITEALCVLDAFLGPLLGLPLFVTLFAPPLRALGAVEEVLLNVRTA